MTGQLKTEGQQLTAVWRNGGCSASYDSFVVGSSAVLRLNICAKNPPLRQAAKRCRQWLVLTIAPSTVFSDARTGGRYLHSGYFPSFLTSLDNFHRHLLRCDLSDQSPFSDKDFSP